MSDAKRISRRKLLGSAGGALLLAGCTVDEVLQQAVILGGAGTTGSTGSGTGAARSITQAEATTGLREALRNGVAAAISRVGRTDGYRLDKLIHIPLPGFLADLQSTLSRIGLSATLDELEVQLNRGAEAAAPLARQIFLDAIAGMTVSDALGIVRGGDTAATDYFRARTTPTLVSLFTPVMRRALENAGAMRTLDRLSASLAAVPLAPKLGDDARDDLIAHGVRGGLDGLFFYIGREETAIRRDPVKRTSEILRKVFG